MPRGGKRQGAGRKPSAAVKPVVAAPPIIAKEAAGITPERVLKELARIGFADLRSIVTWQGHVASMEVDEDSGEMTLRSTTAVTLIDSDKLDADAAAAIAEVTQTKDGALKIKLHAKQPALLALARHLGLLQPPAKPAASADPAQAAGGADPAGSWDGLLLN